MSDYEDIGISEEKIAKKKFYKKIGIYSGLIILIIIIIFLLKSCVGQKNNLEKILLNAGKQHFNTNINVVPKDIGECFNVSLKTLLDEKLLNAETFKDCDGTSTKIKICRLENNSIQYVPFLACKNNITKFKDWKPGKPEDLVKNKSDVAFKFLGSYLDITNATLGNIETLFEDNIKYKNYKTLALVPYYRYRDKAYIWNYNEKRYYPNNKKYSGEVQEYYVSSPNVDYKYKDEKTSGVSKYFTLGERKFYKDGEYSVTSPNGYPYSTEGISINYYRTRDWTEISKPSTAQPATYYVCTKIGSTLTKIKTEPCNTDKEGYTNFVRNAYSCDGSIINGKLNEVSSTAVCAKCNTGLLNSDKTSCGNFSEWSKYSKDTPCTISETCDVKNVIAYKWYNSEKLYYPSKSKISSEENTYYFSSPTPGAIRDKGTTTIGYKWYKIESLGKTANRLVNAPNNVSTPTNNWEYTSWSNWTTKMPGKSNVSEISRQIERKNKIKLQEIKITGKENYKNINDKYFNKESLIKEFKKLNYNVNTLEQINLNGELKYKVKMYCRDRK